MKSITVCLRDCRFFAYHGVFEQERLSGNEFAVNIEVRYLLKERISDNIANTISYADLFEIAKREMGETRKLLETVAESTAAEIRRRWPYASRISVEIIKTTPPIAGFTGNASVTYIDSSE